MCTYISLYMFHSSACLAGCLAGWLTGWLQINTNMLEMKLIVLMDQKANHEASVSLWCSVLRTPRSVSARRFKLQPRGQPSFARRIRNKMKTNHIPDAPLFHISCGSLQFHFVFPFIDFQNAKENSNIWREKQTGLGTLCFGASLLMACSLAIMRFFLCVLHYEARLSLCVSRPELY